MRHFYHKQALLALFLLSITAIAVVFVYMGMVDITKRLMSSQTGVQVDKALDETAGALEREIQASSDRLAQDVYTNMLNDLKREEGASVEELNTGRKSAYYREYIAALKALYGAGDNSLTGILMRQLPNDGEVSYSISSDPGPGFFLDYDESACLIRKCSIDNVVISYITDDSVMGEKSYSINIDPPDVSFSDESANFFDYSLISMKGTYITGETSSFVGSMYAGTHDFEEGREAEVAFGEKDPYGGINFLTTQAAVYGDSIITTGDINLKGAFVLFGSDDDQISVYANTINDIENYPSKTEYTVYGNSFLRDGSTAFVNEEHYENIIRVINSVAGSIDDISSVYNSAEDTSYAGSVSKIISNEDVTLTSDFTGVIITGGNVIIEAGCNVEGLVISGDRIYIYGNNNIVSSRDVVKKLIEEENAQAPGGSRIPKVSDYIGALME